MNPGKHFRLVGLAVFLVSAALQLSYGYLVFLTWGHTFLTYDAISHTYISRLLWFRFENIGGDWLPLFHIFEAPFTLVPALYNSGFAGVIVNSVATGLTSQILYRMLPNRYGVLIALIYAGNIFTLSFSATSMEEPTAILFAVWAIYYFQQYLVNDTRISFFKMAAVLTVGELSRYEVWALAVALVALFIIKETRKRRARNVAFIHLAFWGIILWLIWETAIFRDPIFFLHSPGRLGIGGFISSPSVSAFFQVISRGNILFEAIATLIAASIVAFRTRAKMLTVVFLFILAVSLPYQAPMFINGNLPHSAIQPYGYSQILTPKAFYDQIAQTAHSNILMSTWRVSGSDYLSIISGVDPSRIVDEYNPIFALASHEPWGYVSYVVINRGGCTCAFQAEQNYWGGYFNYLYYADPAWRGTFDKHFQIASSNDMFIIYEKIA